jgi:hypothetical protein
MLDSLLDLPVQLATLVLRVLLATLVILVLREQQDLQDTQVSQDPVAQDLQALQDTQVLLAQWLDQQDIQVTLATLVFVDIQVTLATLVLQARSLDLLVTLVHRE